jgi:hypothetical protein
VSNENQVNKAALKFITQSDQEKVNAFLESCAKPFFGHYLDSSSVPPLYHNTTGDNLIRIIESQELWATQASCLNDTTELTYAADLLRQRLKERSIDADGKVGKFRSRLAEVLLNPYPELSGTFVTCFTEKRDDLSQWRSYSGGEGGYAIQFDVKRLLLSGAAPILESQVWWQPLVQVAYKLDDQFIDALLTFGEQCLSDCRVLAVLPAKRVGWMNLLVIG